jgi:hypothetical protein
MLAAKETIRMMSRSPHREMVRTERWSICTFICCLLYFSCTIGIASAYKFGDLVPTQRRGQYHKLRTHWHDALGRHCPRFGIDRLVRSPTYKAVQLGGSRVYWFGIAPFADSLQLRAFQHRVNPVIVVPILMFPGSEVDHHPLGFGFLH